MILLALSAGTCFAQEPVEQHLLKLNAFTPGITYELGVGSRLTFNVDALLGFYFHVASNMNNSNDENFVLGYPLGMAALQYYFNRKARERRGRSIFKNSGMFIAPVFFVQGPDLINTNRSYVELRRAAGGGGVWGIQRTFRSGINITLNMGLGYAVADGPDVLDGFTPISKFTLGFVIFSRGNEDRERPKAPKVKPPEDFRY